MGVRDSNFAGLALPGLRRTGLFAPSPFSAPAAPQSRQNCGPGCLARVLPAGPASPAPRRERGLGRAACEGGGAACSQPLGSSFLPSWATQRVSSICG